MKHVIVYVNGDIVTQQDELREKILKEMKADYSDALDRNFPLAKEMIRVTADGKVDVVVKDNLTGPDKVALYLIGKRYAHRALLANSEFVKNNELKSELGIKEGSLLPWLKELRDNNMLVPGPKEGRESTQAIALNVVESVLKRINGRMKKTNGETPTVSPNGENQGSDY